uniref:S-protein homolog n=1 Tax=Nelumbo nucifera TaxID=4432 RepID=A0A822XM63_NELNU|nr:TPA_asm: hypothetical protein HUJ06_021622 [Nelumbo nucifera]
MAILALALSKQPLMVAGKYHVFVINDLGENETLNLHCASKNNDLGTHLITFGSNFNWSFNINFSETTLFWCDMNWKSFRMHYDVFEAKRDRSICDAQQRCYWRVQQDGLYFYDASQDTYERKDVWQS